MVVIFLGKAMRVLPMNTILPRASMALPPMNDERNDENDETNEDDFWPTAWPPAALDKLRGVRAVMRNEQRTRLENEWCGD